MSEHQELLDLDPALLAYREQLLALEQKAQADFDRTVMALSGGALGVSITFVDKFLNGRQPDRLGYLFLAWGLWTASLTLVLSSHYFSTLAMRKAIRQVDSGKARMESPGGGYDTLIKWMNALGGVAFVGGLALAGYFAFVNL